MTNRIVGILLAGAIAIGLVFYVFGKIDALVGLHDAQVSDSSRALVNIHKSVVAYRVKLAAAEQRQSVLAAAAHSRGDSLRAALARGVRVDTVKVREEIAHEDSTAYAACSVAFLTCQQRAANAEAEAGRLHDQLARQLTVRDHRCGLYVGVGPTVYADSGQVRGHVWAANVSVGCRILRVPLLP
jgi:hypothetical protein